MTDCSQLKSTNISTVYQNNKQEACWSPERALEKCCFIQGAMQLSHTTVKVLFVPGFVGHSAVSGTQVSPPNSLKSRSSPSLDTWAQEIHVGGKEGDRIWRQQCPRGASDSMGRCCWRSRGGTQRVLLVAVGMPEAGAVLSGEMEPEENQSLFQGSDQREWEMHLQLSCKP